MHSGKLEIPRVLMGVLVPRVCNTPVNVLVMGARHHCAF